MADEWFEDPTRLLRAELLVDDTARQAITAAAELIWDDLLDAVETDTVTDALLVGLLPRQFRDRAAGDWRRWLATFTTVAYKLAQPAPPPPATMAEQLCVGALTRYTQTAMVDLARDGMVDVDVADGGIDLELWVRGVPGGVDHELLYDPALDGIDDDTTDHQYVRADGLRGHIRRLQRTQRHLHRRAAPAGAAAHDRHRAGHRTAPPTRRRRRSGRGGTGAGAAPIHLPDPSVDVEPVAHRVGNLLGLRLRAAAPGTIELVGPVDAETRDRLAGWLNHQEQTG